MIQRYMVGTLRVMCLLKIYITALRIRRDDPCSTCPKAATCGYECKAFTAWCDTGNYADDTVGVFKKSAKKVA